MLDKILGKDDKNKNGPDLRKKEDNSGSDVSGRLKNMISMASDRSRDQIDRINAKANGDDNGGEKNRRIPRPMPKPRPKDAGTPKLKSPQERLRPPQKKPGGAGGAAGGGGLSGFGRRLPGGGRIPDDDRRTLVGAAVFGIILIALVGAGYYFLVYGPYQSSLQGAKQQKLNEVSAYYKGPLALDPQKQALTAEIQSAVTPEQALAVDVIGPATASWRAYQNQQINLKKDPYGRVEITYTAGNQKNNIVKVANAQTLVNEADASVLANLVIKTPDTVVVPIILTRLQAAGGLINVGDSVDVYLNGNSSSSGNQTNQTNVGNSSTPQISGATVLAILRAKDSGAISANLTTAQSIAVNQLSQSASRSAAAQTDVEQLLRAESTGVVDEGTLGTVLNAYGWKLSDFERASNLGELDVQYMVLLEVPRENALFVMQNMNSLQLVVSTQSAPTWMIDELHSIYGSG